MKKIVFITPSDAEHGFRLTGAAHRVAGEDDIETSVRALIHEPDTGLVIIDERLAKALTEKKLRDIERTFHGVLTVLPSPKRREAEIEDYAARLIKRAIGYHVMLRT